MGNRLKDPLYIFINGRIKMQYKELCRFTAKGTVVLANACQRTLCVRSMEKGQGVYQGNGVRIDTTKKLYTGYERKSSLFLN
jgi:hypothetical protein